MLLSLRETMRRIGCSRGTVKQLVNAGALESFQYSDGGWHWIYEETLVGYLRQRSRRRKVSRRKSR